MQKRSRRNTLIYMCPSSWFCRAAVCFALILSAELVGKTVLAAQFIDDQNSVEVTNVRQTRLLASQIPKASYSIRLKGDVLWANPIRGQLVLKDDSGAEELEMDMRGTPVKAGQRVLIEGKGTIMLTGAGFKIGAKGPVVDNDGVHNMVEKSGAVFLKAGFNPLRVEWFNGVEKYGLEVDYEGPQLPRQKIPDAALFRIQPDGNSGASNWVNGLNFRCVQAAGEVLPDFSSLRALKTGTVENFDLSMLPRSEHVGMCFTGFLQVPRDGLYTFYTKSDDGSRLFVGRPTLRLKVIGRAAFPKPQPLIVSPTLHRSEGGQWVEAEGKVTFASKEPDGLWLELNTGAAQLRVEVPNSSGLSTSSLLNRRVHVTGFCQKVYTADGREVPGILLVPGAREILPTEPNSLVTENTETNVGTLPLLVNAMEIHRLKREQAERKYPVKICGVITSILPEQQAFTIQDSTRGIYVVDSSESRSDAPHIGEFLEVEGTTDPLLFAPVVDAQRVRLLGSGALPDPVHPTRDQLMNGSLDAQYVEIQGILASVQPDGVILLTPDGRIKCDLRVNGLTTHDLERYEDALIRVRGCLFATWDYVTHRVKVDEIRIYGADITVEQPAPTNLFSIPRKKVSDLFLFDPEASVFQRVKVSGQIIHIQESECFVMDGDNGIRIMTKHPTDLQVGDLVEAVGFPELSIASPVLREAVMKKIGHAKLPKAKLLKPDDLAHSDLDSTRVRIKGVLVSQRNTPTERALEMRVGLRSFLARLPGADESIRDIPAGSQLELTGTYASQGVSQDVASFELLLNSPSDVVVLARPPWWTLEKLLVILGALGCVLAITVLWITQLHRQVEQRTAELEIQIRERQRAEQQHAMEQERARIAQDLHDELGSGLTEITMLGDRVRYSPAPHETRNNYLEQISSGARQMVAALDEIVWAMNPSHDSLASMTSYFSIYAERFLGLANIAWRLESPIQPDHYVVDSRHRHQLFLAFKEALTNVVRHSGATEVRLNIKVEAGHIRLTITDNGRGRTDGSPTEEMDGVANMRSRLEKLGGRFEVKSQPGQGMVVLFDLPLE
jgi:signal transduction histidine kinase